MMDRLELAILVLGALIVVNAWLTENALKRIKKLEKAIMRRDYTTSIGLARGVRHAVDGLKADFITIRRIRK